MKLIQKIKILIRESKLRSLTKELVGLEAEADSFLDLTRISSYQLACLGKLRRRMAEVKFEIYDLVGQPQDFKPKMPVQLQTKEKKKENENQTYT